MEDYDVQDGQAIYYCDICDEYHTRPVLEEEAETFNSESLKKDSCCCGATEKHPCLCMIQGNMKCAAKSPMCPCYEEIAMGVEVEMEHTKSKEKAEKIAKEHLAEHPDYYSRLKSAGLDAETFETPWEIGDKIYRAMNEDLKSGKVKYDPKEMESAFDSYLESLLGSNDDSYYLIESEDGEEFEKYLFSQTDEPVPYGFPVHIEHGSGWFSPFFYGIEIDYSDISEARAETVEVYIDADTEEDTLDPSNALDLPPYTILKDHFGKCHPDASCCDECLRLNGFEVQGAEKMSYQIHEGFDTCAACGSGPLLKSSRMGGQTYCEACSNQRWSAERGMDLFARPFEEMSFGTTYRPLAWGAALGATVAALLRWRR